MQNERVQEMTFFAMFIALIATMAMIPNIGFLVWIPGFAGTTLHIPVIIAVLYGGTRFGKGTRHGGLKYGIVFGLVFGIFSMIVAFQFGVVMFQNPFVAIVPRILFGAATWYIYQGMKHLFNERVVYVPLTFLLATLAHTVIVIGAVILSAGFYREMIGDFANVLIGVMPINGSIEIALAVLVGGGVTVRLLASEFFNPPATEDE